jgi:hypothetical protein
MTPANPPRESAGLAERWSRVFSAGAGVIGLGELFGWIVRPAWIPSSSVLYFMKANAALVVVLMTAAALLAVGAGPGWRRRVASGLAVVTLLITVPTLVEYLTSWSPGLDMLFGPDPTTDAGRMAAQTAGVLSLLAIATLAYARDAGAWSWATDAALIGAVLVLEVMVTAFFDHATLLYDVAARATPARQSAIAQMLLCGGLVLGRTGRGAFQVFARQNMGSAAMRMIIPAIIALPVLLGRLSRTVQDMGWLQESYAHTVFSVTQTAILGLTVYAFARHVNRLDERYQVERKRREEAERYVAVCAWTRRIRWQGEWVSVEEFLHQRFGLEVTHGISDEALAEQLASLAVQEVLDGAHEEGAR